MELSDAVTKAADEIIMPVFSMAWTQSGPKFVQLDVGGSHNYEYLQELNPLVSKWGDAIGKLITAKAIELRDFDDAVEVDPEVRGEAFDEIFDAAGVDIACGVFALGYLLGSPELDGQKHDRKTFHSALSDRDTHVVLHQRFKGEGFLRDRFRTLIQASATTISQAFSAMNMPHTSENVHEWGKLSVNLCFYEAFQVGLKSRRIWEEDMTFDQIARGLED